MWNFRTLASKMAGGSTGQLHLTWGQMDPAPSVAHVGFPWLTNWNWPLLILWFSDSYSSYRSTWFISASLLGDWRRTSPFNSSSSEFLRHQHHHPTQAPNGAKNPHPPRKTIDSSPAARWDSPWWWSSVWSSRWAPWNPQPWIHTGPIPWATQRSWPSDRAKVQLVRTCRFETSNWINTESTIFIDVFPIKAINNINRGCPLPCLITRGDFSCQSLLANDASILIKWDQHRSMKKNHVLSTCFNSFVPSGNLT